MFFKRIELLGFKSFATKTSIELLPGVTVVVGPNGCGKSNILDAIKWVLGNQSPKSMRGKQMQDVIFAGSGSFKPLGMAQVTLTLDNSRRTLDMDFDEIQVTRRLYRTGESEYLINKVPCRMRDIHNLFLGTGIGVNSYSILEQGRIERIINAKPIERRFLFEEAAGISKYKIRKMEALRKLERTSRDLLRLDDLVSEIDRQVKSLKRQASKAERYRENSVRLREAEMELIVLRSAALRDRMDGLQDEIASDENRLLELRSKLSRQSADHEQRLEEADDVQTHLDKKNSRLFEIQTKLREEEHLTERHGDQIRNNEKRLESIGAEFAQIESRATDLDERREELDRRRRKELEKKTQAEQQCEDLSKRYDAIGSEVKENQQRLETMNQDLASHRDQVSRCENEVRIAQALIDRHEESRQETQAERDRIDEAIQGHEARREDLETKSAQLQAKIEESQKSLSGLQLRHAETHQRIANATERIEETLRELHRCQARLQTLEELKANFEGFYQGVRDVMKASSEGELEGIIGPMVNQFVFQREHERALDAALGEHLQDLVVETSEAGRVALDYLMGRSGSGATFVPLDCQSPDEEGDDLKAILAHDGVIGHAPALIQYDASLRTIVQRLLGLTVVVKTFDDARRLAPRFSRFNYATLDGRMLHAWGALSAGGTQSADLMSREREIQELAETLGTLQVQEAEFKEQIQLGRRETEELSAEIKTQTEGLRALEFKKVDLDKDLETIKQSAESSAEALENKQRQLHSLKCEIESKTSLIGEMERQKQEHAGHHDDLADRIESERENAKTRSDEYREIGTAGAEARIKLSTINERLNLEAERLSALEHENATLADDRQARESEQKRLHDDNEHLKNKTTEIHAAIEELAIQKRGLEGELNNEQARKEALALELKELHFKLEQMQRDERVFENDLHEKQLSFTQWRTNLDVLSEQAREKFDRELLQIAEELGSIDKDPAELEQVAVGLRRGIDRMGPVNMAALEEYEEQRDRLVFLTVQREDLVQSKAKLDASIAAIDETTKAMFHETFESIRKNFIEMFRRLFNGGKADLIIEREGDDPLLDGGVEIMAQPPGKKLQSLTLMSGGEKAMTAIALLFALFLHKPAPFAVLDEIDAPLDDVNVERFKNVVMEFAQGTQFLIISHNKQTMELADCIYGVTMEESGVSKLVSVKFEHADQYAETVG